MLLWRTTRVVNLAQPALGLVGGTLTGLLIVNAGWAFWWAAPVGLVVGAGLSMLAERLVLRRLQDVPRSVLLIATVGLAQVFEGIRGGLPFIFDGPLPTYSLGGAALRIGSVTLAPAELLSLASLPIVALAVSLFLTRSRIGVAALGLGQDTERARSLGVPAGLVRGVVWGIAGAIGSVSGILAIPILGFGLESGALAPTVLLLALAPAVFAGLRSIWGAVLASLAMSVAYQTVDWFARGGGVPDLLLAGGVLVALGTQRKRLGREESAARASAWEAATTPRPLPWSVARSDRVIAVGVVLALLAIAAAVAPAYLLSPSQLVAYGTGTAFALGAVGVAIAWMFAGELPIGHWGFAGMGAALGVIVPGPLALRLVIAGAAIGAISGLAGFATKRRSSLSYAVVGLAAAAAAPVAVLEVGRGVLVADLRTVATLGGLLTVVSVIGLIKLRASTFGTKLVAGRDDPQRAPWLGVDPDRARVLALTLSGIIVGIAGLLFVASTPSGITIDEFAPERSLALLAVAVVGGISSPVGVLVGAVAMIGAERLLPAPWNGLTSGVGVIAVVLFLPAGLSRIVERVRDAGVRLIVPSGAGDPIPVGTARGEVIA